MRKVVAPLLAETAFDSSDQATAQCVKKSGIIKRSILRHGRKSSVSLEDAFWNGLRTIAATKGVPVCKLVETIDPNSVNLSSAIRVFVFEYFQNGRFPGPEAILPAPEMLSSRNSKTQRGSSKTGELR